MQIKEIQQKANLYIRGRDRRGIDVHLSSMETAHRMQIPIGLSP